MVLESNLNLLLSDLPDKIDFLGFKKNLLNDNYDHQILVGINEGVKVFEDDWIIENGFDVDACEKNTIVKSVNDDVNRVSNKDPGNRKRKRDFNLGMLNWIGKVAKNPCNPAIGSIPEMQKWGYYGNEQLWKRILLVRKALFLKRNIDASSQQTIWQKKLKMHPSMYDDQYSFERLRSSQRLRFSKDISSKTRGQLNSESSSSGCESGEDIANKQSNSTSYSVDFLDNCHRSKRVSVGPLFQADVPEYAEMAYESDSKWLGTCFWSLEIASQNKNLIERDPIGKGRQESCGCQFPGSVECVKFHIEEKRKRVKLELGSAFYWWKFHGMGEVVSLYWTSEDENKFQNIVKPDGLSSEKYFWDVLFKIFPEKGREAMVSYYYNVFLLRIRGEQNRNNSCDIHSDDEESKFLPVCNRFGQRAAKTPGSIFCSPKKPCVNPR